MIVRSYILVFIQCVLVVLITGDVDDGLKITDLSQCEYQIEQVGCFRDDVAKRVLGDQVLNSRDKTSKVFTEPYLGNNWKNYPHFLSNFVCECAKKVAEENRGQYFGIQFYGECWSGAINQGDSKKLVLDKYGEDNSNCINSAYKPYDGENLRCGVYSGKNNANYIYRLKTYAEKRCPEYFESVGCFHDNQIDPRPLPDYIMNERDISIPNWNGKMIDWNKWDNYMPQLICRCAIAARNKHYRYFGLQFYGECWAGNNTASVSKNGDGKPDDCLVKLGISPYGKNCSTKEEDEATKGCLPKLCVGKQLTNQVYELKQGPLNCLSNPCALDEVCQTDGPYSHKCVSTDKL